jgi:hypothetical protein
MRDGKGGVRVAPASWFSANDEERAWYREGLRRDVAPLLALPIERVLVSHGEPVLAGGSDALARALA